MEKRIDAGALSIGDVVEVKARGRKTGEYYVDKKVFYDQLVKYYDQPEPKKIPDEIGLVFLKIAKKTAQRKNFRYYSFNDELIEDALENQIYALKFWDPKKSDNPFGYFSRVTIFAFLRRIALEAKQQYVKHKNFQRAHMENGGIGDGPSERSMEVIEKFERKMAEAKERKRTGEKSKFRLF